MTSLGRGSHRSQGAGPETLRRSNLCDSSKTTEGHLRHCAQMELFAKKPLAQLKAEAEGGKQQYADETI